MDVPERQIKRYALVPGGREGGVRRFHLARRLERMEEVATREPSKEANDESAAGDTPRERKPERS